MKEVIIAVAHARFNAVYRPRLIAVNTPYNVIILMRDMYTLGVLECKFGEIKHEI